MKKVRKWASVLLACTMLLSFSAVMNAQEVGKEIAEIISYDSFEDNIIGTRPGTKITTAYGWAGYSRGTHGFYKNVDGENVMSFHITDDEVAQNPSSPLDPAEIYYILNNAGAPSQNYQGYTGKFAIELKLRCDQVFNTDFRFINSLGDGLRKENTIVYNYFRFDGTNLNIQNVEQFTNASGAGENRLVNVSTPLKFNEWATIRFELNTEEEFFDLYVNDLLLLENAKFFVKDIALDNRTESQKNVDVAFIYINNALIANQATAAELLIDDIAVYNTTSSEKYYYGIPTATLIYECEVGDLLTDKKVEVPILNSDGIETGKKIKTPVRLANLDSAVPGIRLATVDNVETTAQLYINKMQEISPEFNFNQNFTDYTSELEGQTVMKDTDGNAYLQFGATTQWCSIKGPISLPLDSEFKLSFRIRFSDPSGLTWSSYFAMQLLNEEKEIMALLFAPESPVLRYNIATAPPANQKLLKGPSSDIFSSCDPSKWYDVELTFKDSKVSVKFDGVQAMFAGLSNTTTAPMPSAETFNQIKFAHRPGSQTPTAKTDIDDIFITAPAKTAPIALSEIPSQEYTTAVSNIVLPSTITGQLEDGSEAVYSILNLEPVDKVPAGLGIYEYNAIIAGYDKPVAITIHVINDSFSFGDLYVDSATGNIAIPVTKLVDSTVSGTLIVVVYNDDVITGVDCKKVFTSGNIITDITAESGDTVKAFIWSKWSELKPMAEMKSATPSMV